MAIQADINPAIIPNNTSPGQCIPLYILDHPIIKIKNKEGQRKGLLSTKANNIEEIKETWLEGIVLSVLMTPKIWAFSKTVYGLGTNIKFLEKISTNTRLIKTAKIIKINVLVLWIMRGDNKTNNKIPKITIPINK